MTLSLKALLLLLFFCHNVTFAQNNSQATQDLSSLQTIAEEYLRHKTADLSDTVNVQITPLDSRLQLGQCTAPEPFMPNGSRLWGQTSIGIRCTEGNDWTVYIKAQVQIITDYVVTAAPLPRDHVISPTDITLVKGDLATLPNGTITSPDQVINRVTKSNIRAGSAIRNHHLRQQRIIQRGQGVKVISTGNGFQVTTDATALSDAIEGQITRAKTESGQTVTGVARIGGVIEVKY